MHRPFSVCVYCGSRTGATPSHVEAAREVGRLIGERGWRLVYGGGKVGLMGVVADAAMAAGANVIGVIPQALMQREVGHQGITQLQVVQTMHQRKQAMAERSDAFIALPGGIGTLEELYEVWTWRQIGYHDRPVGLLNTEGYYDGLLGFMDRMVAEGYLSSPQFDVLQVRSEPADLLDRMAELAERSVDHDDFSAT
ncbi:MAG TPA: TIGR00730 family Rossman fold protein [Burkholderiaceae bacterium]|jgi:uncharacterized protein (TIGR00730 family)|nr:TIGR00730 family Rossman fold protein [Burkholderiaceae bacterium]